MRRSTPAVLAFALLAAASPADAGGSRLVRMLDDGGLRFSPKALSAPVGSTVTWRNDGDLVHDVQGRDPYPGGWDRARVATDASRSKTFSFAGTHWYRCTMHSNDAGTSGMIGKVRVPVQVSPASGATGSRFTITIASQVPPSGWRFEVQRKIGAGDWILWRDDVARTTLAYRPANGGTHRFRARLERASAGVRLPFSPADAITVG